MTRAPIFDAIRAVKGRIEPGDVDVIDMALDRIGIDRDGPASNHRLGSLSEIYESGGRGPGTVSSGVNDPGGVSYGLYQLSSKAGTCAAFVAAEGAAWANVFAGAAPGTPAFTAAWKAIAGNQADSFAKAQHAFIERTHYRPAVIAVKGKTGLDLDARADAVRDATWSVSVQHGGAVRILTDAVVQADKAAVRSAGGYDRALLNAIYDVRSDYVRDVAAKASGGQRAQLLGIVSGRYKDERAKALGMLA